MGISASVAKKTASVVPIELEADKTSLEKANWYFEQGNYIQAEEFLLLALEEAKARYGEDNVETLAVQNNLGVVYCKQGHVEEAVSLHEHVLEHYIHLLGSKHPLSLQAQHNLGLALFQGRLFDEAAKVFESSYHGRLAMLGSSHVDTLSSMQQLSMCYLEEGRFAEAEEVLRVCLSKQRFLLGPDHHLVITLTILQCQAYEGLGKYSEAVELCRSALKLCSCSDSPKGSVTSNQLRSNLKENPVVYQDLSEIRMQCHSYLEHLENLAVIHNGDLSKTKQLTKPVNSLEPTSEGNEEEESLRCAFQDVDDAFLCHNSASTEHLPYP